MSSLKVLKVHLSGHTLSPSPVHFSYTQRPQKPSTFVCLAICLFTYPSSYPAICVSLSVCLNLSASISLSICLCIYVYIPAILPPNTFLLFLLVFLSFYLCCVFPFFLPQSHLSSFFLLLFPFPLLPLLIRRHHRTDTRGTPRRTASHLPP